MRRIVVSLALLAAFGCAGTDDQPDAGGSSDAGVVTPEFECCPVASGLPTCDCRLIGGSVPVGELDRCPSVCDAAPEGETETVDEHGCRKVIPGPKSCLDCEYWPDATLCGLSQRECGPHKVYGMGEPCEIESCGSCEAEAACFDGKCLLVAETDEQLCARLDYGCGQVQGGGEASDPRTVDCGSCADGGSCEPTTHRCE